MFFLSVPAWKTWGVLWGWLVGGERWTKPKLMIPATAPPAAQGGRQVAGRDDSGRVAVRMDRHRCSDLDQRRLKAAECRRTPGGDSPRRPRGPRRPARRRSPRQRAGPPESGARARRSSWCRDCASTSPPRSFRGRPSGSRWSSCTPVGAGGCASVQPATGANAATRLPPSGCASHRTASGHARSAGHRVATCSPPPGRVRGDPKGDGAATRPQRPRPIRADFGGTPFPLGGCRSSLTGDPAASVSAEPAREPARIGP